MPWLGQWLEKDEERVLPRTRMSKNALAKACPSSCLSTPNAGLGTQTCCPALSSKLCPWPQNFPITTPSTCLGAGEPHIHSLPPYPLQALKGSFSLLPLPGEKSSDLEKEGRNSTFHWNKVLKQKRITLQSPFQNPGSCGSQLLLAPPSLGGGLFHIPPQICSFLLRLLLGH